MAERERFELSIDLRLCRISSAVHSTTLPPLRDGRLNTTAMCAFCQNLPRMATPFLRLQEIYAP